MKQSSIVIFLAVIAVGFADVSHLKKNDRHFQHSSSSSFPANGYLPPEEGYYSLTSTEPVSYATDKHVYQASSSTFNLRQAPTSSSFPANGYLPPEEGVTLSAEDYHSLTSTEPATYDRDRHTFQASSSTFNLRQSPINEYSPPQKESKAAVKPPVFPLKEYLPANVYESALTNEESEEIQTENPYEFGETTFSLHQLPPNKPKDLSPPTLDYLPPVSNDLERIDIQSIKARTYPRNQLLSQNFDSKSTEYLPPLAERRVFQPISVAESQKTRIAQKYLPPPSSAQTPTSFVKLSTPSYTASESRTQSQYVTPVTPSFTKSQNTQPKPKVEYFDQTRQADGYHYNVPLKYFRF